MTRSIFLCGLLCLLGLLLPDAARAQSLHAQRFTQLRFDRPLFLMHAGDGSDRLFVVEQAGRVLWFDNRPDVSRANVAIDIRDQVSRKGNEEGLLGLAFHPDYANNRQVFLHYSARGGKRRNVLSRFIASDDGVTIDPDSEEMLLEVQQPFSNHNGGMIAFGPDGYLYVSLGDGGAANDPQNHGQRLETLLGAILRIDVDRKGRNTPYAIPEDNPFVNTPNARPEIWAYGLRNVWRFSFDRETGALWAGDVGQNRWEEIDVIQKGGNYGWNVREGSHARRRPRENEGPFEEPVAEYGRDLGVSVTGGYVYRGKRMPALVGAYIYGDFGTGNIWMLRYEDGRVQENRIVGRVRTISSFGEDAEGELYATSFDGRLYKFTQYK